MADATTTKPSQHTWLQLKLVALIVASVVIAYLCYLVLLPFLPALIWAIALTIVAMPLHRYLDRKLRRRTLASTITVVLLTVCLIVPLVVIMQQLVSEATGAVKAIQATDWRAKLDAFLIAHPRLAPAFDWVRGHVQLDQYVRNAAGTAGSAIPAAFAGSLSGLTQLAIALFTTFFLLRDSEYFLRLLRGFIPLSEVETDDILERVKATVDASIRGRILIAAIQGALGGLMFWFLGIPGPLLWGTVMAVFALVPMLGAFIVWVPAAIYLLATGEATKAIVLIVWGAVVIGTADNFLYPMLVGKDLRLHTITIFFAVLGGVAAFGASGLVMGPVIFALGDALIEVWNRREPSTPAVGREVTPMPERIAK